MGTMLLMPTLHFVCPRHEARKDDAAHLAHVQSRLLRGSAAGAWLWRWRRKVEGGVGVVENRRKGLKEHACREGHMQQEGEV